MKIAIIPARGGSKRVPLKNIRDFQGVPIISRTIQTLVGSNCFDRIIVSTESEEVARCVGSEPSIEISWRNMELSKDSSNTVDVIAQEILQSGISPDSSVCCVYAPNPFLTSSALTLGLSVLSNREDINYVTPVTSYPFPTQRSLGFTKTGQYLEMCEPEFLMVHSQQLEPRFHETAQFWWGKGATWLAKWPMQMKVAGIYTPRWMTQDIDTLEDWKQAEIRWKILDSEGLLSNYEFNDSSIVNQENFLG